MGTEKKGKPQSELGQGQSGLFSTSPPLFLEGNMLGEIFMKEESSNIGRDNKAMRLMSSQRSDVVNSNYT